VRIAGEEQIMTETDVGTDVLGTLKDAVGQTGASRVFGTPIQQNGTIVLPVAKVGGGGGGGGGAGSGQAEAGKEGTGSGSGGGFGVSARPAGVYVLKEGRVAWRPALDLNRVILGGQVVAVVALLVARSIVTSGRRARGRRAMATAAKGAALAKVAKELRTQGWRLTKRR
jgi:uncharacterized spore protein YtfJ